MLADIPTKERVLYIQKRLDRDANHMRIYTWTWLTVYTGLAVGNAVRFHWARTEGNYKDTGMAVAGSAFGLVVMSIMPPAVLRDQHKLARIVSRLGRDDDCAVLAAAEKILLKDAASEAFGRGPLPHAGSFVFNVALGVFVGAVLHRWQLASILAPVAIGAGELQEDTAITHIDQTLNRYRAGDLSDHTYGSATGSRMTWSLTPQLGRGQGGLGLSGAF